MTYSFDEIIDRRHTNAWNTARWAAFSCILTGGRGETISTLARWSGQCKRKMRFCNYFSAIPHFDGEIGKNIDESNH